MDRTQSPDPPDPATHCPDCFQPGDPAVACTHCGFEPGQAVDGAHYLAPFTTLHDGRYQIGRILGQPGAYGVVYSGWHQELRREVAIKEFFPTASMAERARDQVTVVPRRGREALFDDWCRRFLDEARLLASFAHSPRIVEVSDVFRQNGSAYLVMDRLRGESLSDYLKLSYGEAGVRAANTLRLEEAEQLLSALLEALQALHDRGVLHRDISPANLFLRRGRLSGLTLLDFGLARSTDSGPLTSGSAGLGTPGFSAPEQRQPAGGEGAQPPGAFTDLYAVGAVLYLGLGGRTPPDVPQRLAGTPLKPLRSRRPDLPAWLLDLVDDLLRLDPRQRPQSVAEIRQRLAATTLTPMGADAGIDLTGDGMDPAQVSAGPGPSAKPGADTGLPEDTDAGQSGNRKPVVDPGPGKAPMPALTATPTDRFHAEVSAPSLPPMAAPRQRMPTRGRGKHSLMPALLIGLALLPWWSRLGQDRPQVGPEPVERVPSQPTIDRNEDGRQTGEKNTPIEPGSNPDRQTPAEAEVEIEARERAETLRRAEQQRRVDAERQREAQRQAEAASTEAERQAAIERRQRVEAERQAEAARQREAQRQAEAERQSRADAERQAEAARQREAERRQRAEAERQAEAARQLELQRQAEAARQREAQRQAEAERRQRVEAEREAEAVRQAEAQRQAEAERRQRAEAARLAEVQRQAEAARQQRAAAEHRAEAARQAEAQRQAEAARQQRAEAERQAEAARTTALDARTAYRSALERRRAYFDRVPEGRRTGAMLAEIDDDIEYERLAWPSEPNLLMDYALLHERDPLHPRMHKLFWQLVGFFEDHIEDALEADDADLAELLLRQARLVAPRMRRWAPLQADLDALRDFSSDHGPDAGDWNPGWYRGRGDPSRWRR